MPRPREDPDAIWTALLADYFETSELIVWAAGGNTVLATTRLPDGSTTKSPRPKFNIAIIPDGTTIINLNIIGTAVINNRRQNGTAVYVPVDDLNFLVFCPDGSNTTHTVSTALFDPSF
jgi:hypothetical protein